MFNVVRIINVELTEQQFKNLEEFLNRVQYNGTMEVLACHEILHAMGKGVKKRMEKDENIESEEKK